MSTSTPFELVNDAGTKFNAVEISSKINTSNLSGASSMQGLSSFRLVDGRALNKVDENSFVLVQTGEHLHRAAP